MSFFELKNLPGMSALCIFQTTCLKEITFEVSTVLLTKGYIIITIGRFFNEIKLPVSDLKVKFLLLLALLIVGAMNIG